MHTPKSVHRRLITILTALAFALPVGAIAAERSKPNIVVILADGKDSAIAVCSGQWKLIVRYGKRRAESYELYDLFRDPGELIDLSEKNPEITKRLAKALQSAESAGRTRP